MKTYELVYYINVPDGMNAEDVKNMVIYKPHLKRLVKVKEHDYVKWEEIEKTSNRL